MSTQTRKTPDHLFDWGETVARYIEVFGDVPLAKPVGFRGANFMTSNVLGYHRAGRFVVEVSTGLFPDLTHRPAWNAPTNRVFGFTVRPEPDGGASRVCSSLAECRELFDELAGS